MNPEERIQVKLSMSLEDIIDANHSTGALGNTAGTKGNDQADAMSVDNVASSLGSPAGSGGTPLRNGSSPSSGGMRGYRGKRFSPSRRNVNNYPYSRPNPSPVSNRVYVGNLSWQTSWQDLKDHMRSCGNVVYADIFQDESGRSKGCGIVEYSNREDALQAIKTLSDTKIGDTDRLIFVREDRENSNFFPVRHEFRGAAAAAAARPSGARTLSRQVFVGNLPYSTTWQELKDHFRQCGKILRADTLVGPDGRPKGQGTILFERRIDAEKAMNTLSNTEFQGRVIIVHEDKYA